MGTSAIVTQYNAEAISQGQTPIGPVSSFKARNEKKRAELGLDLPGQVLEKSPSGKLDLTPNRKSVPETPIKKEEIKTEGDDSKDCVIIETKRARSRSTDSFGRIKRSRSPSCDKSRKRNKS